MSQHRAGDTSRRLSRRATLEHLGLLGGGLVLGGCSAPRRAPTPTPSIQPREVQLPSRPNVVVVYADDLGWFDTAFQGSHYYETPNLDALAASGVVFTSGYANAPNCAPSRACLLTGQYTPRHGVYTVRDPDEVAPRSRALDPPPNNLVLPTANTTLAEVLSAAGYRTAFVGKWHVGHADSPHGPLARGFDVNVGGGIYGKLPSGYFPPYDLPHLGDDGEQYLADRLTDEAISFLRDHGTDDDPFFLLYSAYSVHTPLQAPESDVDRFREKPCSYEQCNPTYAGMIAAFDRAVGRLLETLKTLGIQEETLVIFSSDNGGVGDYGEVGITGNWAQITSQGPLRGGKGTLYEGGIRVPTVVSWPGVVPGGTEISTPIAATDVFPTVVELAEADTHVPADHTVDGESLLPLLGRNQPPDRSALFWHFPAYLWGPRAGEFRTTPVSVVRAGRWKLHYVYERPQTELYDLQADPREATDLSRERPDKRVELLDRLRTWKRAIGARDPTRR